MTRQLFPKTKLTVREYAVGSFQVATRKMMSSKCRNRKAKPGRLVDQVEFGYRQVWFCTIRYFTKWYGLTALAHKIGFASDETDRLLSLDPDREIAREALITSNTTELPSNDSRVKKPTYLKWPSTWSQRV